MGSVALPYFEGTRYMPRMVLGSLAAGGALGNLIPPGITFIIYGLITETSVGALYIAAIGPSILVVRCSRGDPAPRLSAIRCRRAGRRDPAGGQAARPVDLVPTAS